LQLHPRCTAIVDEAAAKHLKGRKYYRWIFNNEPEWAEYRDDENPSSGSREQRRPV
jgi:glucosamine-6-phosphate deaminase